MGAVIDASVLLIAAERGKLDLARVLLDYGDESIAIVAVTASELLHGVHRAVEPSQRNRREAFVERLLADLPLIPFDLVVAREHARLPAQLAATGSTVGAHDFLIAATAARGRIRCGDPRRAQLSEDPGTGRAALVNQSRHAAQHDAKAEGHQVQKPPNQAIQPTSKRSTRACSRLIARVLCVE